MTIAGLLNIFYRTVQGFKLSLAFFGSVNYSILIGFGSIAIAITITILIPVRAVDMRRTIAIVRIERILAVSVGPIVMLGRIGVAHIRPLRSESGCWNRARVAIQLTIVSTAIRLAVSTAIHLAIPTVGWSLAIPVIG